MGKRTTLRPIDLALWLLAVFMALGLLLISGKIGADKTGHIIIIVVLCLMFVAVAHPLWQFPFLRSGIGFALKLLIAALLVSVFGWFVWRSALMVDPKGFLGFDAKIPNQEYTIVVTNQSDTSIYGATVRLVVHPTLSLRPVLDDFDINVPFKERRSINPNQKGEENDIADIFGFLGIDERCRPTYLVIIHELSGHESRTFTISRPLHLPTELEIPKRVDVEPDYFSDKPIPTGSQVDSEGTFQLTTKFKFTGTAGDLHYLHSFVFYTSPNQQREMFWTPKE